MTESTPATLADIRARRAKRAASIEAQREAQLVVDYEAIESIEDELGPSNVSVVELNAFAPGLPAAFAVKVMPPAVGKRYHDRLKPQQGRSGQMKPVDAISAVEEVGAVCLVYPPAGETRDALLDARPNLLAQAGGEAIKLAEGRAESEGKE
jgi:hypothetical protein